MVSAWRGRDEATPEETSKMSLWTPRDHRPHWCGALAPGRRSTEAGLRKHVISSSPLNLQSQEAHLVRDRHSIKTLAKRRRVDGRVTVTSTRTQVPNPASDFYGQCAHTKVTTLLFVKGPFTPPAQLSTPKGPSKMGPSLPPAAECSPGPPPCGCGKPGSARELQGHHHLPHCCR